LRQPLLLLALLTATGAAWAQSSTTLYKSTGSDGKTVYSDRPPASAQEAKAITFQNAPATPLSSATLAYIETLKRSADARAKAPPPPSEIVLYSAAWCGYCKAAKAYLAAKQVAYREFDIDTKDGLLAFAQAGGKRGVPLLLVNGQSVSGYSEASYDAALSPRK
jgi:glutaredoxin